MEVVQLEQAKGLTLERKQMINSLKKIVIVVCTLFISNRTKNIEYTDKILIISKTEVSLSLRRKFPKISGA